MFTLVSNRKICSNGQVNKFSKKPTTSACLFFRKQWRQALVVGFLLNLFTWPLLHIFLFETRVNINLLESLVAIIEGLGYFILMKCKWWKALLLSVVVN